MKKYISQILIRNKSNFIKPLLKKSTTRLENHLWLKFVKVLLWLYSIPSKKQSMFFELLTRVQKLRRNSGDTWSVAYLKEVHRLISHWLSGHPDNCSTVQRVAVRGLPLILPNALRREMYKKVDNKNFFRCCLTFISVFRVMDAALNLKIKTITDPFNGKFLSLPQEELKEALKRLTVGDKFKILNVEGKTPYNSNRLVQSTTAGPNNKVAVRGTLIDALAIYKVDPEMYTKLCELATFTSHYLRDLLKKEVTTIRAVLDFDDFKFSKILHLLPSEWSNIRNIVSNGGIPQQGKKGLIYKPLKLGKLSTKIEAAGKVRVFAMVDIWTQSIMAPLHKALFRFLSQIPTDGTFNQLSPLERVNSLPKEQGRWSFDLSAATDRLPIDLQKHILSLLTGNFAFADLWANVLVDRDYHLNFQKKDYVLRYAVGQPMGALSSWAMLALTHHVIVQIAAMRAGYSGLFRDYAVLGDDVVIANKTVAYIYLSIMRDLGLEVNLSKSLISEGKGVLEFAKRWFINNLDVSPASPALVTRFVKDFNYLPTLILDLIGRGVQTIDSNIETSMSQLELLIGKLKSNIKFALIPFTSKEYLSWLTPLLDVNSLTEKDIFYLFELTDRVFNRLSLSRYHQATDQSEEIFKKISELYWPTTDGIALVPHIPIPSHLSLWDNMLMAKASGLRNLKTRSWRSLETRPELTYESYHDYLVETLSEIKECGSPYVPDIFAKDSKVIDPKRESKVIQEFMNELWKDMRKWHPTFFERSEGKV